MNESLVWMCVKIECFSTLYRKTPFSSITFLELYPSPVLHPETLGAHHTPMLKRTLLITAFLVPLTALAIEIQPADFYSDVRAGSSEAAGINLLTREGIVQGYGDRHFGPSRLVNRAEFLKIAILASPDGYEPDTSGLGCFPDVKGDAWFAPYVCAAKAAGIVSGNADPKLPQDQWTFNPADTVTYDAALKMLILLYRHPIPNVAGENWAEPYYQAAVQKGVDLPIRITFDTPMTRGMAARLAGAFMAENAGKLVEYRLAEAGKYDVASSSSSSESSSSSSSSSVSSSSSSSSSVAPLFMLPPVSHFLVVGSVTDALASGVLRSSGENSKVQLVQVKLFSEVRSIDYLELVTENGQFIAKLTRRLNADTPDYKQTFETQIQPENQFLLPQDTDVRVVLRAVVRTLENAGFSDELLQVRTMSITMKGDTTSQTINTPITGPFVKHQTSFGRLFDITRVSPATTPLVAGTGVVIGSYSFNSSAISGKNLKLRQLVFSLAKSGTATVGNWTLVNRVSGAHVPCTTNEQAMTVTCLALEQAVGVLTVGTPFILDLKATVYLPAGSEGSIVETSLSTAGSPESLGSIEWTDESGIFRWVEGASPIVTGTRLQ